MKSFEICDLPSRTARFIARKNWFVVGSDDLNLRVYNYNTHHLLNQFEAHSDYIRSIAVHPSQPIILSCGDDMVIKAWDWEKGWRCVGVFEGHSHYVMSIAFNPKDPNTFASASLDKLIKVWSLGSGTANFTLEGHEKGVNWVDYYHGADRPYLVSGADDFKVKIWDYQNKTCISSLEGHTQNVCVVLFHPELPVILSGSEDGTVKVWNSGTWRLENTLNYGMERVWSLAYLKGSNSVGIGFDEGAMVIKMGKEDPAVSMDNSGKVIFAKHNEINLINLQQAGPAKDGDKILVASKDLGNSEVYPQALSHSPNGRFAVVCGDGEYIIYTALSWRNKSFGSGLEFCWSQDSNEYAVRESATKVKLFKSFKERLAIHLSFASDLMSGGALIGIRGNSFVCFYDWNNGVLVRRIDVVPNNIYWSENGDLVAICTDESYFVLRYKSFEVDAAIESSTVADDGVEKAFEVLYDIPENVKNGCWIGDCFIYTTSSNRLSYLVGGQVHTIAHFDATMYLLGYLPKENKVFVCDKDMQIYSYVLSLSLLEYQTAILRKDFDTANSILPSLPNDQRNKVARFLEGLELYDMAMQVTTDIEHKFDLSIHLGVLQTAYEIAKSANSDMKWKKVGDFALQEWKYELAEECFKHAKDLSGLFLLYQAIGDYEHMSQLAKLAIEEGFTNLAFTCYLQTRQLDKCVDLLVSKERFSEASIFAKTYCPIELPSIVSKWKESISKGGWKKIAEAIAVPTENEERFEDLAGSAFLQKKLDALYGSWAENDGNLIEKFAMWLEMGKKNLVDEIRKTNPNIPKFSNQVDTIESDKRLGTKISNGNLEDPSFVSLQKTKDNSLPTNTGPVSQVNVDSETNNFERSDSVDMNDNFSVGGSSQNSKNSYNDKAAGASKVPSSSVTSSTISSHSRVTVGGDGDEGESTYDNLSHISMEVNTTGTGSVRGDIAELDSVSELSFVSNENLSSGNPNPTTVNKGNSMPPMMPQTGSNFEQVSPREEEDEFVDASADAAEKESTFVASDSKNSLSTTGDGELDDLLDL